MCRSAYQSLGAVKKYFGLTPHVLMSYLSNFSCHTLKQGHDNMLFSSFTELAVELLCLVSPARQGLSAADAAMGAVFSDALNSVVVSLIALAIVGIAFPQIQPFKFRSWGVIT